jgi:cell filamentation protein, protein adenylyltransferase
VPGNLELSANFRRYTPAATHALTRIAAARAHVDASEIRPAAEDELRVSALAETVHFSTLIEGNELPIIEAERAARGDLDLDTKAKVELVNYVDALRFLDDMAEEERIEITPGLLLALHEKTTHGLGSESSEHFKPRHEGAWRDGVALVVDRATNRVMHEGPPAEEVEDRIAGLCTWIAIREERLLEFPPPVIAAVAHYAITDIHPFADGNGRVARLVTAGILMRLGFMARRLFSFEKYYALDREAYYAALRSVRARTLNMNNWLEYFLHGLAEEYERVARKVRELEDLGLRAGAPFQLTASQERGLVQVNLNDLTEFRRVDYERLAEVNRSKANRDLKSLEDGKLIVRRGKSSSARYRLRGQFQQGGRRREWTDDRIERQLKEFCRGRADWPSVADFRRADMMPLYEAIRRYGGRALWARRVGLA